jgi:hypothetical protein
MEIRPTPTDEEAAAIAAAVQTVLLSGAGGLESEPERLRWRWSGRWWSKPIPLRRSRPW